MASFPLFEIWTTINVKFRYFGGARAGKLDCFFFLFFFYTVSLHAIVYNRYNHLKEAIESMEDQLKRLRDPLQLNLPTPPPRPTSNA